MENKVEDKAIELMDKAADGVEALTVKLAEIGAQYGPEVVDAGLAVARLTAGAELFWGLWLLVLGLVSLYILKRGYKECKDYEGEVWDSPMPFLVIIPTFVSASTIFPALFRFANIWNWVGVVEPKLWIAHRILGW